MKNLSTKIKKKEIKIGIIGLGYVGLDLAILFGKRKFFVYGIDKDKKKVNKLKTNKSYINYIPDEEINKIKGKVNFSDNLNNVRNCDVILICLPTPLTKNKTPDLSFIKNCVNNLKNKIKKNQLIILESTTYPGTTEELLIKNFGKKFNIGQDLFIGYSPERIDPGRKIDYVNIPKIVSGYSKKCLKITNQFYSTFFKTVPVKDLKTAEITKLYENIYRSINIGLVNEMKIICDKLNINIFDVIDAAKTKPYGFSSFYPGPGLGGHCVPIDPYYLSWKVKSINMNTRFIELAAEINGKMPKWIVDKIKEIFNSKKIVVRKAKILILGLSYKKNINDMRESPSVLVYNLLKKFNMKIDVVDPYCDLSEMKRLFTKSSIYRNLNRINLKKYDASLIIADHDEFNYSYLLKKSKLIIDTRGRYRNITSTKIFSI